MLLSSNGNQILPILIDKKSKVPTKIERVRGKLLFEKERKLEKEENKDLYNFLSKEYLIQIEKNKKMICQTNYKEKIDFGTIHHLLQKIQGNGIFEGLHINENNVLIFCNDRNENVISYDLTKKIQNQYILQFNVNNEKSNHDLLFPIKNHIPQKNTKDKYYVNFKILIYSQSLMELIVCNLIEDQNIFPDLIVAIPSIKKK